MVDLALAATDLTIERKNAVIDDNNNVGDCNGMGNNLIRSPRSSPSPSR
jgi:hypothetical protein